MKCSLALVLTVLLFIDAADAHAQSRQTPAVADHPIAGTWLSNWGPVTLTAESLADGTHIRGMLQQDAGQKGTVTNGRYDPEKRQLTFEYFQHWNAVKGGATLILSPDGKSLTGTWHQPNGNGPYSMQLLFRGNPPNVTKARAHVGMPVSDKPRLEVLPVLFIPRDCNWITQRDIDLYSHLIFAHLELAQNHYKSLLKTDTFKISNEPLFVFRAQHDDAFYLDGLREEHRGPGAAQLIGRELLYARHQDRYSSNNIYVIIYVRAKPRIAGQPFHGGGRTFNGPPNNGAGSVEMELSSLLLDEPYRFQAALNHEIGHAFGLQHPDVYGYDQKTNDSNMSYNIKITSRGLNPVTGGKFNAEDLFTLGQNKLAFPDFRYVPAEHNPTGRKINPVYLPCMTDYIGQRRNFRSNSCMEYPCPCK